MSEPRSTLIGDVRHAIEVRKSRFLALAAPVASPDDAAAFLQRVADPQATHNCWAWRIGQAYRFSDDGEPGGTAGRPILAAIDGQGFDQAMVVVTRWYGGIKLGAGGLVRAYGGAAAECLRTAPRQPLLEWRDFEIACSFALEGTLRALLADLHGEAGTPRYDGDGLHLPVRVLADQVATLQQRLADASRGQARLVERGEG